MACETACTADTSCGGFEFVEVNKGTHSVYKGMLKGLDCEKNMKKSYSPGGTKALFGARPFV